MQWFGRDKGSRRVRSLLESQQTVVNRGPVGTRGSLGRAPRVLWACCLGLQAKNILSTARRTPGLSVPVVCGPVDGSVDRAGHRKLHHHRGPRGRRAVEIMLRNGTMPHPASWRSVARRSAFSRTATVPSGVTASDTRHATGANRPTAVSLITNARHVETARHVLFPARLVPLLAERSAQQRRSQ